MSSTTPGVAELRGERLEVRAASGSRGPAPRQSSVHPHPLDLAGRRRRALDARRRTRPARRRWWRPGRTSTRAPSLRRRPRSNPLREPLVQLGEVAAQRALAAIGSAGATSRRSDGRRPDQQVGGRQRLGQPLALPVGQRRDDPRGQLLGPVVEARCQARPPARRSASRRAGAGRRGRGVRRPALVLQPAQQPGQVAASRGPAGRAGRAPSPAVVARSRRAAGLTPSGRPVPRNDSSSAPIRWV